MEWLLSMKKRPASSLRTSAYGHAKDIYLVRGAPCGSILCVCRTELNCPAARPYPLSDSRSRRRGGCRRSSESALSMASLRGRRRSPAYSQSRSMPIPRLDLEECESLARSPLWGSHYHPGRPANTSRKTPTSSFLSISWCQAVSSLPQAEDARFRQPIDPAYMVWPDGRRRPLSLLPIRQIPSRAE